LGEYRTLQVGFLSQYAITVGNPQCGYQTFEALGNCSPNVRYSEILLPVEPSMGPRTHPDKVHTTDIGKQSNDICLAANTVQSTDSSGKCNFFDQLHLYSNKQAGSIPTRLLYEVRFPGPVCPL
jgi:hypothetical protein